MTRRACLQLLACVAALRPGAAAAQTSAPAPRFRCVPMSEADIPVAETMETLLNDTIYIISNPRGPNQWTRRYYQ